MTKVLFDANRITQEELVEHKELIREILAQRNNPPKFKKLKGIAYQDYPTYRAKIDKQLRLVYTFVHHGGTETLLLLEINKHNYKKLKRELENPGENHVQTEDIDTEQERIPAVDELTLVPAVSYLNKHLEIDEPQQKVLRTYEPTLVPGPPGAGKTALIYNLMQQQIYTLDENDNESRFLYISLYEHLVQARQNEFEAMNNKGLFTVEFHTWDQLIQNAFPYLRACDPSLFATWLKTKLPKESPEHIHYELSLIAVFGGEHYLKLGKRQCYYKDHPALQKLLITLVGKWREYLEEQDLFDPMVTMVPLDPQKEGRYRVFIDEAQNLPPMAFPYLIALVKDGNIVIGIDSQQCLNSSPFTQSCIKELMHKQFGQYGEQLLTKTWRCPPEVTRVANRVMQNKNALEVETYRREYHEVVSALPEGRGLASWTSEQHFSHLKPLGASPQTVVIAANLKPGERKRINDLLGTNNILSPRGAIGLDFLTVILWMPFSATKCLLEILKKEFTHLSLEQSLALNALYVAVSRPESMLYIYEPDKRGQRLGTRFFGDLPQNVLPLASATVDPETQLAQWEHSVGSLLQLKHDQEAREIMAYHLQYSPEQIEQRIENFNKKNGAQVKETASLPTQQVHTKSRRKPQPSKSKAVKPAEVLNDYKQKLDSYVKDLIKSPSRANLENLFKHPKAAEILFNLQSSDDLTVFQVLLGLLTKEIKTFFLVEVRRLMISKDADLITAELLGYRYVSNKIPSTFHHLATCDAGLEVLVYLAQRNHQLFGQITPELLCEPFVSKVNQGIEELSVLFLLTLQNKGNLALAAMISNPHFAGLITGEVLCKRNSSNSLYRDTSPMYWLSRSEIGLIILTFLLEYSSIAEGITGEDLCIMRPKGTNANTSVLYNLCSTEQGARFLLKLLELNPAVAQTISFQTLTWVHSENRTIFNQLAFFLKETGRKCLITIFTLNPKIVLLFTKEHLFKELDDGIQLTNLFSCLTTHMECMKLLRTIFIANPQLITVIEESHFLKTPVNNEGLNLNIFQCLCVSEDGIGILDQIITYKPELALYIGSEIMRLDALSVATSLTTTLTPLRNILAFESGIELLLKLMGIAPEIAKHLPKRLLTSQDEVNNSPVKPAIELLVESSEGRTLLNLLLEHNTELTTVFDNKLLFRTILFEQSDSDIATPFSLFCLDESGQRCLTQIIDANPESISGLTLSELENTSITTLERSGTLLSLLEENPIGRGIINRVRGEQSNALARLIESYTPSFFKGNNSAESSDEVLMDTCTLI